MTKKYLVITVVFCAAALAQGCAPVIVAGGATAVVAASDQRTLGAVVDDASIEMKATKARNDNPNLGDDVHINITSMNGIVLLTGEAKTTELRDEAVAEIRPIPGIRRIINEIQVAEPTIFANRTRDTWITGRVKAKLLGTENFPSRKIKVITEDTVVYLMGLVTQEEGNIAAEAARTIGDVTRVVKLFEYVD